MAVRSGVRFVADDIWESPEDGNRYEVIDGGLYVTPPPVWQHQHASDTLFGYLWQHIHPRRLGKIVTAPIGVVLDSENGIQPDLVYVSRERMDIITESGIKGVPDLVVEVLSPSTRARDRGIKMRRYAGAGVPHYWIVDPRTRAVEEYALTEAGYSRVGLSGTGDVFRPALFPGLGIPVDDLWT